MKESDLTKMLIVVKNHGFLIGFRYIPLEK